ncbi:MAG: hydroxysqualene dehydroxylase HpnE [Bacteroidota bacterium]
MTYDAVIVGGGLSGLSAAVELSSYGFKTLLLEQRQHLGGRTNSFVDEVTGDVIDNGQHLMMGCYRETRKYLQTVGAENLMYLQPSLHIDFLRPGGTITSLSCPTLPPPLHVLAGLMKLDSVPFSHRLSLLNVGKELLWTSPRKEARLESMTVDSWLTQLGQTEENKKYLWDILAIGTLNDSPQSVSALLFFRVLRAAFLGARENSCLLIPRVGLSDCLVEPARVFLRDHGGEIRTGAGVYKFNLADDQVASAELVNEQVHARTYVLAVPHHAAPALFDADALNRLHFLKDAHAFQSSPIITINLWFDRHVLHEPFVAVLDSRIQWIFNRTKLLTAGDEKKGESATQHLAVVISGASTYVELDKSALVTLALEDLARVLPVTSRAELLHSLVLKEKRATFSPRPGVEKLRPGTKTQIQNLFLAGDWTATGLPATIEGSVQSGRAAAAEAAKFLSHHSLRVDIDSHSHGT